MEQTRASSPTNGRDQFTIWLISLGTLLLTSVVHPASISHVLWSHPAVKPAGC